MPRFIGLVLRASALPLGFIGVLAAAMYLAQGIPARLLAVLFVLAAAGATFHWVIRNVKAAVRNLMHPEGAVGTSHKGWRWYPGWANTAADELVVVFRSHILLTLLGGYLLLALVFALAFHAVGGSTAESLGECFYFSLTTLATVGYGDIAPVGFGRVLSCIEMVTGVAFHVIAIGGCTAYLFDLGRPHFRP